MILATLFLFLLVPLIIFVIVCECLTVRKSGNPWWAILIPFYSNYILFKMGKKPKLFWVYLPFQILSSLVKSTIRFDYSNSYSGYFTSYNTSVIEMIFGLIGKDVPGWVPAVAAVINIVVLILEVILSISIAKAFGKGVGFGIGLILLPFVFWAILAFDSSIQYVRDDVRTDEETYYAAE